MSGVGQSRLSELNRTNLRQQALSALRRSISAGDLAPGTHLSETPLSEQLGISRGTLREALRQLQQEGLVSAGPSGRLSVRHLDNSEILGIFQVRSALEELAAALTATSHEREDHCHTLMACIDRMEDASERSLHLDEQIEVDLDFHRTLCRVSGNSTLLHSWQSLEGAIRMSIVWAGRERAMRNMSWTRHRDIVTAIATGDERAARMAVSVHMAQAIATLTS